MLYLRINQHYNQNIDVDKKMNGPYLPEILELRRMRKVIGLTQDELAQRAGISQSMIAKIEI